MYFCSLYVFDSKMNIIQEIRGSSRLKEFLRFCVVGGIAMSVHYIIYLSLLYAMGLDWSAAKGVDWRASFAYTIGYLLALALNMYLTARFTFREKLSVKRGGGFLLSHAFNYFIEIGLLNMFLAMHFTEWISPLLALLISVPVNFLLVRLAFKKL